MLQAAPYPPKLCVPEASVKRLSMSVLVQEPGPSVAGGQEASPSSKASPGIWSTCKQHITPLDPLDETGVAALTSLPRKDCAEVNVYPWKQKSFQSPQRPPQSTTLPPLQPTSNRTLSVIPPPKAQVTTPLPLSSQPSPVEQGVESSGESTSSDSGQSSDHPVTTSP
ncbi:hypothetical protein EMCRGX_G004194 [Ephydatia muelleri]